MRRPALCAAFLATFTLPVLAGPPLVCHPWITEDAPRPSARAWMDRNGRVAPENEGAVIQALDAEPETLVRMDILQRVLVSLEGRANLDRFLRALEARATAPTNPGAGGSDAPEVSASSLAGRRFDYALAVATAQYLGGRNREGEEASVARLRAAVAARPGDAAAWLALARASTPLMRTGTLEEHAKVFIRASDLVEAMPEGDARARLQGVLRWDLENLEAYLFDTEIQKSGVKPSPEARLAALRRVSGRAEPRREISSEELNRFMFFAVLEGLYADGVPDEVVSKLLRPKVAGAAAKHEYPDFIYGCPICVPVIEALRAYAMRRDYYYARKGDPYLGPSSLPEDLRVALSTDLESPGGSSDPSATRRAGIQRLIDRYVTRRFESLHLSEEDRSRWQMAIRIGMKLGMELLRSQRYDADCGMERCPSCEGATSGSGAQ